MSDPEVYLSNKHVILSSGGTKYNDLYYHHINSTAALVECTYSMGKYSQSLSSLSFNSTSNINVPNQSFLGECYLELELDQLPKYLTVPRGWGYSIIEEIRYIVGSSNTSTISLSGESLWSVLTAQMMDSEKRSEFFKLGGEQQIGPVTPTPGLPVSDLTKLRATVLIPWPWSYACDRLPFDTSMLTSPIVLTVKFKSGDAIFGGAGTPRPTAFKSAVMTFRQGDLSNTNLSLRNTMIANPSLIYSYPMTHFQGFQSPPFTGIRESQGFSACTVNLNGFINSDILGIMFYVVQQKYVRPTTTAMVPNPFITDPVSNIRLLYNGIPLYTANGESYKMINMVGNESASSWQNSLIHDFIASTTAPSFSPYSSYLVYMDFSRLRSACYPGHMANCFRISNQTLQLNFNTKYGSDVTYLCYATYVYNGIIELKNGQSFIYFD